MVADTVRVLVVEDSELQIKLITGMTTDPFYERFTFAVAKTLASALDQLDSCRPDVILLDLNLPDSEGLGTLRKMIPFGVPVVVLTGENEKQSVEAISIGADDYISKANMAFGSLYRSLMHSVERSRRREAEDAVGELNALLRDMSQGIKGLVTDVNEIKVATNRFLTDTASCMLTSQVTKAIATDMRDSAETDKGSTDTTQGT